MKREGKGKPRRIIRAHLIPADLRALLLRHGDKSMRFGTVTELRGWPGRPDETGGTAIAPDGDS